MALAGQRRGRRRAWCANLVARVRFHEGTDNPQTPGCATERRNAAARSRIRRAHRPAWLCDLHKMGARSHYGIFVVAAGRSPHADRRRYKRSSRVAQTRSWAGTIHIVAYFRKYAIYECNRSFTPWSPAASFTSREERPVSLRTSARTNTHMIRVWTSIRFGGSNTEC